MTDPGPTDSPPDSDARPQPPGTLRIGSLAGADVFVSSSWILMAVLLAVLMAAPIEGAQPGLGPWKYVAGLAFAVLLYLSVLLHEGAHAAMARHYGYPVGSITLHFLGGVTAIEGESRRPREEFWIAIVGPLASLAVGGVAFLAVQVVPDGLLHLALALLSGANLLVGVLNLLPGLPLDGGRVLKSAVWAIGGNQHRGTIIAAWAGRLLAISLVALPVVLRYGMDLSIGLFDMVLLVIVAVFLWTGATAAMSSARLRRKLPHLVGRALARRTVAVPDDTPLSEAVRQANESQAGSIVTVTSSGHPVGVVSEAALLATPEDRRPWVAVSAVARTLEEGLSLPADIAGEELIVAISRRPADEYLLVEDDGSIFGVLTTADVDQAFRAVH